MDTTALMQSLVLTAAGMLVVFVFMGLLILVVKLFLVITFRFFPDRDDGDVCNDAAAKTAAAKTAQADEQVAAAIAAALQGKK